MIEGLSHEFPAVLPHRTRIIATLGPSSSDPATIREMILAGMEIARINLSHGTAESHTNLLHALRKSAIDLSREVSVFLDLPGTKMRVARMEAPVSIRQGDEVVFRTSAGPLSCNSVPVNDQAFFSIALPGATVSLGDGLLRLLISSVSGTEVTCTALDSGVIGSRNGIVVAGGRPMPWCLTDADRKGIAFGIREGIRIFAVSYMVSPANLAEVSRYAQDLGATVRLIAKIERPEAVTNLDAIVRAADAVMVARGDLGVQIPPEELPALQKRIIRAANLCGTPVITATQMMESMTTHPIPTRAEVTDVANAIFDGTDCVMLSGETAAGEYPVRTVEMMARTATAAERAEREPVDPGRIARLIQRDLTSLTIGDVISLAVTGAIRSLPIRLVATPTTTGGTPRRISRFRPPCPIIAFTRDPDASAFLRLSRGVYPVREYDVGGDLHTVIAQFLKDAKLVTRGDLVILTEGRTPGQRGTDSLRILEVR